ncbi:MAG: ABC-2 family transporter protein [Candidatus Levybacteria bacterium]|nr:ABC-2 family transporter protein [Candidatus Levybacteria bacterium]MBI2420868.1 ABC-2 family transporter protein [Candidatus Levybacteria bacterium]
MKKYLKLWYMYSIYTSQVGLQSRFGAGLFLIGKFLRFGIFLFFFYVLSAKVDEIAGYTFWQMIFIFSTFNLVDIASQLLLREVYRFRGYVVTGSLDYFLIRPISPIFRFLFGGADILDFPMFITSAILVIISLFHVENVSVLGIIAYFSLVSNALLIALAFHIFVLAMGILTTEVDNTLWLYRDLLQMGRIPTDLYTQPIRALITFAMPVGIMITFPAKALFGTLSPFLILLSFGVGFGFLIMSYLFWQFSLRRYSSASS